MKKQLLIILFVLVFVKTFAGNPQGIAAKSEPVKTSSLLCGQPSAYATLDVNNVKAELLNGGDMWWDLFGSNQPRYEVPKGSGMNSTFAAGIWLGGIDQGGQLRIAAMTYRQSPNGTDFYPGPLNKNASTSDTMCHLYDKIWKITRAEVEKFVAGGYAANAIPQNILNWPGDGLIPGAQLAPYFDNDGDNNYNPENGDYPYFAIGKPGDCSNLVGDEVLFWVMNDVGGPHNNSGSLPLGVEVQVQAFAFSTNDANNNNTYYKYKIINRSSNTYHDMYFGLWNDIDLGVCNDDFVGCDVQRGMGYGYNADLTDDNAPSACSGELGYGSTPPAFGIDILKGPIADPNDGIDNDLDGVIDEADETISMSTFTYFNNDATVRGDPTTGQDFYNYMKGLWKDGTPFTYGKNAYKTGGVVCHYMFPDTSDPKGFGTGGVPQPAWSEYLENNAPADRRFVLSTGKFTLLPGGVTTITLGALWARADSGNNRASIIKLQSVSDQAQALADNCFVIPCESITPTINYKANELNVDFFTNGQGTYKWDFGDGTSSTLHHPSHTYTSSGSYTITLEVQTACGTKYANVQISVSEKKPIISVRLTRIEGQGNGGQTLEFVPEMYDSILNSSHVIHATYDYGHGPVYVELYDTSQTPKGDFAIALSGIGLNDNWKIWRVGFGDTVYSSSTLSIGQMQTISKWGMRIQVRQVNNPGVDGKTGLNNNGYLTSSITFSDPTKNWLSGLKDYDLDTPSNWIRSGNENCGNASIVTYSAYCKMDINKDFQKAIDGTWAPYRLSGYSLMSITPPAIAQPAVNFKNVKITQSDLKNVSSIDVIITPDKSKWTRCVVLEAQDDSVLSEGNAIKLSLRKHASVDKYGQIGDGIVTNDPNDADYIAADGMGWFPGFAVNLETGERLNMAFAEDSYDTGNNGKDMLWNPTSVSYDVNYNPVFGGKHFIYIFGHNGDEKWPAIDKSLPNEYKNVPRYDKGKALYKMLTASSKDPLKKNFALADAMWVSIPLKTPGHSLLETEAIVKLRVSKSYKKAYSASWGGIYNITNSIDTTSTPINKNFPLYNFNTKSSQIVGVENKSWISGSLSLFPNPIEENTTLRFSNTMAKPHELVIYGVDGREVLKYSNITSEQIQIHKSGFQSGMYFYLLTSAGQKVGVGKFIVE